MDPRTTEIVYVCSENFWRYLFLSLRTLFWSNPNVRVRVMVVSDNLRPPKWHIDDQRVTVEVVPDIAAVGPWGYYWGNNKIHLCRSDAERVIYLDTDVMVLKPLSSVYDRTNTDLVARYAPETYRRKYWTEERWKTILHSAGGDSEYPFYSPGFMVFQNGSHKTLAATWNNVIERILMGQLPLPINKHAEMYAFSIAASLLNLSHTPMQDCFHRYAMIGENWSDAVVYHLGTPGFYRHYFMVERALGLARKEMLVSRPRFIYGVALFERIKHRLKRKISHKKRDESLDY